MNKWALITGGTKGIGFAVADCLAKAGYNLILTYASSDDVAAKVQSDFQNTHHNKVHILRADVSDMNTIDVLDRFLEAEDLKLDALVLNAGLTCRDPFETMTFESWNRVFYANVHFPVFLLQRIVGRMNRDSSVVFTGSLMGIEPHSVSLAYGVTKSAVHALTKNLVKFLAPYSIRVNAVAPGFIETDMTAQLEDTAGLKKAIPMGRFGKPEEVAELVGFLASSSASYITGEVISINGGLYT